MTKKNTIVFKVNNKIKAKVMAYYADKLRPKTPPYAVFQAEEADTVVTLYESGKIMFQGPNALIDASMWQEFNEVETKKETNAKVYYHTSAIGSDEVGTGDYFGPIVVTAAFVSKDKIKELEKIGVNDSKLITDEFIKKNIPEILKYVTYESIILSNLEYNEKYSENFNLNKIKAILHNAVLSKLANKVKEYDHIIIDEFCSKKKYFEYLEGTRPLENITFIQKAESVHLSVAVASMISRYIFLNEMDKLSKDLGIILPKGAGPNTDLIGEEIVKKYDILKLKDVAKLNFKNTDRILKNAE